MCHTKSTYIRNSNTAGRLHNIAEDLTFPPSSLMVPQDLKTLFIKAIIDSFGNQALPIYYQSTFPIHLNGKVLKFLTAFLQLMEGLRSGGYALVATLRWLRSTCAGVHVVHPVTTIWCKLFGCTSSHSHFYQVMPIYYQATPLWLKNALYSPTHSPVQSQSSVQSSPCFINCPVHRFKLTNHILLDGKL